MTRDTKLWIQYLGTLNLLGELAAQADTETKDRIERAFIDANKMLAEDKSTIEFAKSAGGGWAAFERRKK